MMLSSGAVDRVCGYRLETTAKLIAVGLLESGRIGCGPRTRPRPRRWRSPATEPVVSLRLQTSLREVKLFTVIATLGAQLEVTAATYWRRSAECCRGGRGSGRCS